MAAEDGAQRSSRNLRMPSEEGIAQRDPGLIAEVAAGKRSIVRPRTFEVREVRSQALQDHLGEMPVSGDLAAEDREYWRHTRIVVDAQRVIASHRRRIAFAIV